MSKAKKIFLALLLVFSAIQFIKPAPNTNNEVQRADFLQHLNVPANIAGILKTSCYDCHSNNSRYPWYSKVQPVGWILAKHINDGKTELNFNEFNNYSRRRQLNKLKAIQNSIKDRSMPTSSYTIIHEDANLSDKSKALILEWTSKTIDSLSRE